MPMMQGGLDMIDAFMAAIRQIESGGNYTVLGPPTPYGRASGAYQFLDSTWGGYGGFTRAADAPPAMQDERARQLMTQYFNQFGSWDLVAIAWHAGPGSAERVASGQVTPDQFHDGYASTQTYLERASGVFRSNGGTVGGGGPGQTGQQSNSGGQQQNQGVPDRYPPNGRLFRTEDGTLVLRYGLGRGVQIEFEVTDMDALRRSGYNPGRALDYRPPRNENFILIDYETAGNASEIGQLMEAGYESLDALFEETIYQYFSPFDPAIRNREIRGIIAQIMANPEIAENEAYINSLIQQTDWWARTTEIRREWNSLPPAEQDSRIFQQADLLRQAFFQETGRMLNLNDSQLQRWARQVASGRRTFGQITQEIRDIALQDPESPYSRTQRQEEQNRGEFSVNVEDRAMQIRGLAQQWGVTMTDQTIQQWANDIEMNARSEADLDQYFRGQAQILYPWMDQSSGMTTRQMAEPWLQTYARLMERSDVSLFNEDVQQALTMGMSIPEFSRSLRSRPEWQTTQNARDTIGNAMGEVSRIMGFN